MYIIRDNTGQVCRVHSLDEVARIVQLDPHEIAWALEEYGRCETDTYCVFETRISCCQIVAA